MGVDTKTLTRRVAVLAAMLLGLVMFTPPAEANIVSGIVKIISGVLQVPLSTMVGTFTGPPIIGTVMGALNGTFQGLGLVAGGALDLAVSGFELAKMAAPYVLPFVF